MSCPSTLHPFGGWKLQEDLLLFSKYHPVTLLVSPKVCVVSVVLKSSESSETLLAVPPVDAQVDVFILRVPSDVFFAGLS